MSQQPDVIVRDLRDDGLAVGGAMRSRQISRRSCHAWTLVMGCAVALSLSTSAQEMTFPADAGVIDVTQPPYNARRDGRTDDTAAIQKALDDHPNQGAILFLPIGTYLVSDTLKW